MRKILAAGMAAVTALGAMAWSTAAAAAPRGHYHHRDYGRYHHDRRDNDGAVLAAGILGLALGAAVASSNNERRYYDRPYYGEPYYGERYYRPGSYYGQRYYQPQRCTVTTRYDRYGRVIRTERCY